MRWFRILLRHAYPEALPEVDLHRLSVPEALSAVEQALRHAESRGDRALRIVCGKGKGSPGGRGILREAVAGWLESRGYKAFRRDVEADGRDGAVLVELSRDPPLGG